MAKETSSRHGNYGNYSTTWINSWKFNGMLEKNIENISKSDSNFPPAFVGHHFLLDINFNGQCFIKIIFQALKKL